MPAPLGCYQLHLAMSYFKHHQSELYPCRYHQLPSFPESPEVPGCMGHPAPAGQCTPQIRSPNEKPVHQPLRQDNLLSFLPPGTRFVPQGTSVYPSGFQAKWNCRGTGIREVQRRIQLQQLKRISSSRKVYFWKTSVTLSRKGGYTSHYKPIKAWQIPVIDKNPLNYPSHPQKPWQKQSPALASPATGQSYILSSQYETFSFNCKYQKFQR